MAHAPSGEAAERRATPPARRPAPPDGGDGGPRRGGSLQNQARNRLKEMLENDSQGLGQRPNDDAKQELRGHLDQLNEQQADRE